MTGIQTMQRKYLVRNYVTFGLDLRHQIVKGVNKKKVLPPRGFNNFNINSYPKANAGHNALGMCTGMANNLFVIDVDEPHHWTELLNSLNVDPNAAELQTCQQHSANGGFHLFFEYNETTMSNIMGTSISFGNDWSIDVRTNGNFIFVHPSHFKNDIVDWSYRWEPNRSLFDMNPLPLPQYLIDALNQANERRGGGVTSSGMSDQAKQIAALQHSKGPFFAVACGRYKGVFDDWQKFLVAVMYEKRPIFNLFRYLDEAVQFLNQRPSVMKYEIYQKQTTYLLPDYRKKKWIVMQLKPNFNMYNYRMMELNATDRSLMELEVLDHILERSQTYQKCHENGLAAKNISTVKNTIYVDIDFTQSVWTHTSSKLEIQIIKIIPGQDIWMDTLKARL